jgi:CheY-like chemotaxis protein
MRRSLSSYPVQPVKSSLALILDDDQANSSIIREIMEQEGYQVVETKNAQQVLEISQQVYPDIVFLGEIIPAIDGFMCCQRLQDLYAKKLAVIMITSLPDAISVRRAFAAGVTDYIIKPIHQELLRQKVLKSTQQSQLLYQLDQLQDNKVELEHHLHLCRTTLKTRSSQLQKALFLEATFDRISDRVRNSLDPDLTLQMIVDELVKGLGAIRCNIGIYDQNHSTSRIIYERTTTPVSYYYRVLKVDNCVEIHQKLMRGISIWFCPMQLSPIESETSMFVFPILHLNKPFGYIWLVFSPDRILDKQDIRCVRYIANQCAITLNQVSSFKQDTRRFKNHSDGQQA